jgi:hypothetical protein
MAVSTRMHIKAVMTIHARIDEVHAFQSPVRAWDFAANCDDRSSIAELCHADFACLPCWDYIVCQISSGVWAVWQEPRAEMRVGSTFC